MRVWVMAVAACFALAVGSAKAGIEDGYGDCIDDRHVEPSYRIKRCSEAIEGGKLSYIETIRAHYWRSVGYRSNKQPVQQRADLEKALGLDPTNKYLLKNAILTLDLRSSSPKQFNELCLRIDPLLQTGRPEDERLVGALTEVGCTNLIKKK